MDFLFPLSRKRDTLNLESKGDFYMDQKLSLREKLSYGGGDTASCITFGVTSAYLSYYYTDVAGISLAAVGLILGTARILEAGANLFTGIAIDRTTSRLGRTKPFLYFTTIPLMVMFFLMFVVPDISSAGKTAFAFATYLGFCLLYAANNTAYGTLLSMMTGNVKERLKLNNYKLMGCGFGNMIASLCTLPLVALIGTPGHYSFVSTALIYAIVSLILLGNCALTCKERIGNSPVKMDLKESFCCAIKSRSWIMLCIINCLAFLACVLRSQSSIYYAEYCLNRASLASLLLTMSTVAMLASSPFVAKILSRFGNRSCMFFGFLIFIVFSFVMYLAGGNVPLLILCSFLCGIGSNLATGPAYSMCSDTMDEVEELTGKRPQGLMTSVMMCAMKLGIAAAGMIFTTILDAGNYTPKSAQVSSALAAIRWNMFWLPMIFIGICVVLTFFFQRSSKKSLL